MITFGFRNKMSGLLRAVAAIVLGIVMVAMPGDSLELLVQILAAILIASGLVSAIFGIRNKANGGLGLMVFNSVVDILLGILIFCFPGFVADFIIILLGILLLVSGLFQIFSLVSASGFVHMGVVPFVFPVLAVAGGFLLVFQPGFIAKALTLVAGIVLLIYGISELIASWKMRKAMKEYDIKFGEGAAQPGSQARQSGFDDIKDVDYEKVDDPS